MNTYDKIVIVTKQTALEELLERHSTRSQARFYLEHVGVSFDDYEAAHCTYHRALDLVRDAIPGGVRRQEIDRRFLPTFTFGDRDLVVTLGPDGLAVNTAKYLSEQPLVAFNPDPARIDGILIPFHAIYAAGVLHAAMRGHAYVQPISMAKAELTDGQVIYAVNDLFIGQRTHVSARYQIQLGKRIENQSSSGVIVSTGAGSTGWFSSIVAGAMGIATEFAGVAPPECVPPCSFDWAANHLYYSVREPFVSKTTRADMVFGRIEAGHPMTITSQMPQNGVIFSDGIEADYLEFNSGAIAKIGLAEKKVRLLKT